jgi:hypothetical protein
MRHPSLIKEMGVRVGSDDAISDYLNQRTICLASYYVWVVIYPRCQVKNVRERTESSRERQRMYPRWHASPNPHPNLDLHPAPARVAKSSS